MIQRALQGEAVAGIVATGIEHADGKYRFAVCTGGQGVPITGKRITDRLILGGQPKLIQGRHGISGEPGIDAVLTFVDIKITAHRAFAGVRLGARCQILFVEASIGRITDARFGVFDQHRLLRGVRPRAVCINQHIAEIVAQRIAAVITLRARMGGAGDRRIAPVSITCNGQAAVASLHSHTAAVGNAAGGRGTAAIDKGDALDPGPIGAQGVVDQQVGAACTRVALGGGLQRVAGGRGTVVADQDIQIILTAVTGVIGHLDR